MVTGHDAAPRQRGAAIDEGLAEAKRRAEADWRRGQALLRAGDVAAALAWLDRAHRLAPSDQNLRLSLAAARLRAGDEAGAATLFEAMARLHGTREAWMGLAAARRALGQTGAAAAAIGAALATHAADPGLITLARDMAQGDGWCALGADGTVHTDAEGATLTLDGAQVAGPGLPPHWTTGRELQVRAGGVPLLGSPIDIAAIRRTEGLVWLDGPLLRLWAWHPGATAIDPVLTIERQGAATLRIVASDSTVEVDGSIPLARPRGAALKVPAGRGPVHVRDQDGRDLLGSPVYPGALARRPRARPRPGPNLAPPAIVVPIYRGMDATLACLRSVLDSAGGSPVIVVDDASPEPALVAAVAAMARADPRLRLIRLRHNRGFPGAANAGLRAAGGRDAILLNADTLVAPGWIARLAAASHAAADIGTASPLSNDATILTAPDPAAPWPAPDLARTAHFDALAAQANRGVVVDIPTGHGFCLYLRADCLAETGLLREDVFAQGYGEENDFCERAAALGWRHAASVSVFVAHRGGMSFGAARPALLRRNLALLNTLHPGYDERIAAFVAADPLAPARRRIDALRWREGARPGAVLLITHADRGGVNQVIAARCAAIRADGLRPIVLRGRDGATELGEERADWPALRFDLPRERPALLRLLRADRPVRAELHHRLGHDPTVADLPAALDLPCEIWVHDYADLCPRITFVTGQGRYCGEPPDPAVCDCCVAAGGRVIDDPAPAAVLRACAAARFTAASRVVVPHADVARRIRRSAPRAAIELAPWQDDAAWPAPALSGRPGGARVVVVGAIGVEKGLHVLRACAEDAAGRDLPLDFRLVGFSADDAALHATGRVFVTGEFAPRESSALIGAQAGDIAFLPSIWPETWCFALGDCWRAGLRVAVFDIGAPAARVRATGLGWVLPLGLPPDRVNDALLVMCQSARQPVVAHG